MHAPLLARWAYWVVENARWARTHGGRFGVFDFEIVGCGVLLSTATPYPMTSITVAQLESPRLCPVNVCRVSENMVMEFEACHLSARKALTLAEFAVKRSKS